ncbi:Transgelin [Aphelenchoides fujianensis]|nr:Transgelin [Aphelenchoides fujianensis]
MANHGPSYGLSREIQQKNQARFNIEEAQEVLQWISEVAGLPLPRSAADFENDEQVSEALKDGVILCTLMTKLTSPAMKFNKNPRMPFHKMENISNFLEAIKNYGVPEISCFQTVDLYENKQCYKVIECLRSLAAVAQSKNAPVQFPNWVVKLAQSQPRRFSDDIIRQGEAVIPLQYGTNKGASQKGDDRLRTVASDRAQDGRLAVNALTRGSFCSL